MNLISITMVLICVAICAVSVTAIRADKRLPPPSGYPTPFLAQSRINPTALTILENTTRLRATKDLSTITVKHSFQPGPLTEFLHYQITRQGGAATVLRRQQRIDERFKIGQHAFIRAVLNIGQADRINLMAEASSQEQQQWSAAEASRPAPENQPGDRELVHTTIVVMKPEVNVLGLMANEGTVDIVAIVAAALSGTVAFFMTIIVLTNPKTYGRDHRGRPLREDYRAR